MLNNILFILLIIFCDTSFAFSGSDEVVDEIMRGIGIKFLVSTDRKLPKEDRTKWEDSLSNYVDFESLNNAMMRRIKETLNKLNDGKTIISPEEKAVFEKTSTSLGRKAALFLVPKELTRYTVTYLRKKDELGIIAECSNSLNPVPNEILTLCINDVSENEIHVNFTVNASISSSLVFKKGNKWVLSSIEEPISKEMLELIARWK